MSDTWVWEDTPAESGWYAILFCWDEQEGVHVGSGYWEVDRWSQHLPVVGYAGPFADAATADEYATTNDPDM